MKGQRLDRRLFAFTPSILILPFILDAFLMSLLRSNVLAAKARLAKGYEDFKRRHHAGCSGGELLRWRPTSATPWCLELVEAALADLGERGPKGLLADIALVAHGGYGRRDVAPYSDVDLMILRGRPRRRPGWPRWPNGCCATSSTSA